MTYAPMFVRDEERMNNLNISYNNGDVESVNMLRMKKVAFNQLVNTLRGRQLLRDNIHTCIEEQVAMFLHVVGRTNDSESSIEHGGDRLRQFLSTSKKCYMLLEN
jgi:hypothetical protein